MKKWIYLVGLSAFMFVTASCGGNSERVEEQNNFREEPPSAMESAKAIDMSEEPQRENVNKEELPEGILQYVKEDSILSTLEFSKAEKVKMDEDTHYELTFLDEEDQLVMVTLDKEGKVIEL